MLEPLQKIVHDPEDVAGKGRLLGHQLYSSGLVPQRGTTRVDIGFPGRHEFAESGQHC